MDMKNAKAALAAIGEASQPSELLAPPAAPAPVTEAVATTTPAPAFDPIKFQEAHRVHISGASYLGKGDDAFLIVHPEELKPESLAALRGKMARLYTHQEPIWFTQPGRLAIISSLAELIPLSSEAEGAKLSETIQHYIQKTVSGKDPQVSEKQDKEASPFAAYIKSLKEDTPLKPDQIESVKNGIGMYLLLEEAVKAKHPQGLAGLAGGLTMNAHQADMLFAKLLPATGLNGPSIIEAARTGGLVAAGKAMGVKDDYIQEVVALVNHLPEHKFSSNAVENWKIGRLQPGMALAGVHEKIMKGVGPRIEHKINALKAMFHNRFEVSAETKKMEEEIAGRLRVLPPAVTEAFFRRGGEIVYNPAPSLNNGGLHGLYTHSRAHPDDLLGIDQVFIAGGQGADSSQRTGVHELTHVLYPNYLTQEAIARTDALALSDRQRLNRLHEITGKWIAAKTPEEKAQLEQQVETEFAVDAKPFSALRGQADMNSLYTMVEEAWRNLSTESPKLILSGYSDAEKRMAEINSRYAELRFVRLREQPDLLRFIVPGLTEAYEQVYLPHVERAVADLRLRQASPAAPHAHQGMTPQTSGAQNAGAPTPPAPPTPANEEVQTTTQEAAPSPQIETPSAMLHPTVLSPVQQAAHLAH